MTKTVEGPHSSSCRLLWRVGNPDAPPPDLWTLPNDDTCLDAAFDVMTDDEAEWQPFLPGPLNGGFGFRPGRRRLRFELDDQPNAAPWLRLHYYTGFGPAPELELAIANHRGIFYPPTVRGEKRDIFVPSPIAARGVLECPLPLDAVVPGANDLEILAVSAADVTVHDPRAPIRTTGPFGSALIIYCVELMAGVAGPAPGLTLLSTPFRLRPDGRQLLTATVRLPYPYRSGAIALDTGEHEEFTLAPGYTFGEVRTAITRQAVSPDETVTARLTLRAGRSATLIHESRHRLRAYREWTLVVIPHVHIDLGYSDPPPHAIEMHAASLGRTIEAIANDPSRRFSLDASMLLSYFSSTRTSTLASRLHELVAAGSIGVNAFHSTFLTGLADLETCLRGLYDTTALRVGLGEGTYANLTDVPSYSSAIPTILASCGVPFFMGLANHNRAQTDTTEVLHLNSPFYWLGPDGSQVLTFLSDLFAQVPLVLGDPPTLVGATQSIGRLINRFERSDYPHSVLPIVGSHGENEDAAWLHDAFIDAWNERFDSPRINLGTIGEYFQALQGSESDAMVFRGDMGSFWEDGTASNAKFAAELRALQTEMEMAEAMAAMLRMYERDFQISRESLDAGWHCVLAGIEHTWGSRAESSEEGDEDPSFSWKRRIVSEGRRRASDLIDAGLTNLVQDWLSSGGGDARVIVWNPSSVSRSDRIVMKLPFDRCLVDSDEPGAIVHEVGATPDGRVMQVPSMRPFEHRVYRVRRRATSAGRIEPPREVWPQEEPRSIETSRFSMSLNGAGLITSLVDRTIEAPLVEPSTSAPGLGRAILVMDRQRGRNGTRVRTRLTNSEYFLPDPDLVVVHGEVDNWKLREVSGGYVYSMEQSLPDGSRIRSRMTLCDAAAAIDLDLSVERTRRQHGVEALYVCFPFALASAEWAYDRQIGWVDPLRDHLPGACNEWFSHQSAVVMSGEDHSILWACRDAALFTFGDVVRGRWPANATASGAWLASYVMNNYWDRNYMPSQVGSVDLHYRFEATAGKDLAYAKEWGNAFRHPLQVLHADTRDRVPDDSAVESAVSLRRGGFEVLELERGVLLSFFRARDGRGFTLRLVDGGGSGAKARIGFRTEGTWWRCTGDEVLRERLSGFTRDPISVSILPSGLVNLRFIPVDEDSVPPRDLTKDEADLSSQSGASWGRASRDAQDEQAHLPGTRACD